MKWEELKPNKIYYEVSYTSMTYEPKPEFFTNKKEANKHYNYLKRHYDEDLWVNGVDFVKVKTFVDGDGIDAEVTDYIKEFDGKTEIKW